MFDKIIDVILGFLEALLPFVILMPYERGIWVRLGHFKDELGPGFHWVLPLHLDRVFNEHVTSRTSRLFGLSTTTSDGKSIGFEAVVTWSISDIKKALLKVTDLTDAVNDSCAGVIGTELSKLTWSEIWQGDPTEQLSKICRSRGWKWGIEIESVQLVGVATVKNIRVSGHGEAGTHVRVTGV